MIELFKGTMIINELERVNTDMQSQLTIILNNGYEKGLSIGRVEGDKKKEPKVFDVYSPKIITSRKKFKDLALESRILTIPMAPTKRTDIAPLLDEYFWSEAERLRNKLLMYRFKNLPDIDLETKDPKLMGVEPRLRQTLLPILSVIKDPEVEKQFLEYASSFQENLRSDRGLELEGIVAIKLLELLSLNDQVTVKQVTEQVNEELGDTKYKPSPQKVGRIIREDLGFKTERGGQSGAYRVIPDEERISYIKERFGLESSDSSEGSEPQIREESNSLNLLNSNQYPPDKGISFFERDFE
jgi:hypothetical protein